MMLRKLKKRLLIYPKTHFWIYKLKLYIQKILSVPFLLFPIQNNKIVISSYSGKGYGDNGKYIVEEIIRKNLNYDIVWILNKNLYFEAKLPKEVRRARKNSLRGLYELATAKIWIDNSRKTFYPIKRKEQFYIQTWHGGLGLKKIEKDAEDELIKTYIYNAKKDSKMADLFISNSTHLTQLYKNSFWYSGEILEFGYPKNDIFFKENSEIENYIKKYFNLQNSTKILLYAPTFRKNSDLSVYNIDYNLLLDFLEKETKEDWVIIIRLHPNLSKYDNFINYSNKIINGTSYPDMQELVIASDILISDYSSCMFDSEMMKIPTYIYASDKDKYMEDRGFYFELEELPFPVAANNKELLYNIKKFDQQKYEEAIDEFNTKVGLKDRGVASEKVVEVIKKIVEESK